ncbi:MAG: deoxyribose-phosphate aldolase [Idiomarina sp.]|nr:deoxyribose-phosphate aldolase [Idiomarina sp.]
MTEHTAFRDAALAFSLLDLTSLTDTETAADIEALAENAQLIDQQGRRHTVAALCVFPRFIPLARKYLDARELYKVRIATVSNFPHGQDDIDIAVAETRACVAYGADEVDVVFPYRAFQAGDETLALQLIQACKASCPPGVLLKVILETGELKDADAIARASDIAIAGGADFIKTSTGKVAVNATPAAAEVMLAAIAKHPERALGFKPAGGIRTLSDALVYMNAVRTALGDAAVTDARFRIGASSVRSDLATILTGSEHAANGGY